MLLNMNFIYKAIETPNPIDLVQFSASFSSKSVNVTNTADYKVAKHAFVIEHIRWNIEKITIMIIKAFPFQ